MKLQKTLFITRVAAPTQEIISQHANLPYTKVVLFYDEEKDIKRYKIPQKIQLIHYTTLTSMKNHIKLLHNTYYDYRLIPYFSGDKLSKYAIYTHNLSFGNNIDSRIFKDKDKMSAFLGDVTSKKSKKYTYKELKNTSYQEVYDLFGNRFILKPTNASSSTLTFKIKTEQEYLDIFQKLSKSYDYIIEEYIGGNLFSLDFYMDGTNMYLLTFVREIAMIDLIETKKFSEDFLLKYGEELEKHFNFVLPIRYNVDFEKISKEEIAFFEKIRKKLTDISYHGLIHLEYKFDTKTKNIGFIEWGARAGWKRINFIKKIYHTDLKKIPFYLEIEKDKSRFKQMREGIFCFKEKEHNLNIIGIKTNFIKKTSYVDILKKTGNMLTVPFSGFIANLFKESFGIAFQNITFQVVEDASKSFLPFYVSNKTRFDYLIQLNDENFTLFKKKKPQIVEKVFFHNYK